MIRGAFHKVLNNKILYCFYLCILHTLASFSQESTCISISNLPDTIITCPNTQVQLDADLTTGENLDIYELYWTPADGLSDPYILDPVATIGTQSIEYTLIVEGLILDNLIANWDFSAGPTGFYTEYIPGYGGAWGLLTHEGTWAITSNPSLVHTNFASFFDKTTGTASGSMMVINGAATANTIVWLQNVVVKPDTWYDFSAWGASCHPEAPALLQFRINGVLLGNPFQLPSSTGVWVNFHEKWYSGNNTNAEISIVNQQTAASGNDFALDDLEFFEICQSEASVYIKVPNLQPEFTYEIIPDCDFDQVNFFMIDNIGDKPDEWLWEFGDGNSSTEENPINVFSPKGVYNVTLTFASGECRESYSLEIDTQSDYIEAKAIIQSDKNLICIGETVNFYSQSTGVYPLEYFWDFGDGDFSNEQNPAYIFEEAGEYIVYLSITDGLNCFDMAEIEISVLPFPQVDPVVDQYLCHGESVTIDLSNSDGIITWHDGDEQTIRSFDTEGSYSYYVTNAANCYSSDTFKVFIYPEAISNIYEGIICEGSEYDFLGHIYDTPGIYIDTVRSILNCDSIYFILELHFAPSVSATINADKYRFCLGDTIHFFANCHGTEPFIYNWEFGDSLSSSLVNPLHVFHEAGAYLVKFSITDANLCSTSETIEVVVSDYPLINPVDDHYLCFGETIEIAITNEGEEIIWNDGYDQHIRTIVSPGRYQYVLTNDFDCAASDSFDVFISEAPLTQSLSELICRGEKFIFLGKEYGIGHHADTLHNWHGCDSLYYQINVAAITDIGIETDKTNICAGESIFFNSLGYGLPEISYYWDFGDGNISTLKNPEHTFDIPGIFNVLHIITDGIPCNDTATIKIIVYSHPAIVPVPDHYACYDQMISIDLQDYTGEIIWHDGNNEKFRLLSQSGTYIYTNIDQNGCMASDTFNVVFSEKPVKNPINLTTCYGEDGYFMDKTFQIPGIYMDTVYNIMGCDSLYWEIEYSNYPTYPLMINGPDGFCKGNSVTINVITDHNEIRINGNATGQGLNLSMPGEYLLEAVNRYGCRDSLIFHLEEYPSPEVFTTDIFEEFFVPGRELDVDYTGNIVSYIWTPPVGLDCYDCPYPIVDSKWEGIYTIEIINEYDCYAKTTLEVRYKQLEIYIPNVIYGTASNPKNQVFYISSNTWMTYNLKIFDRWGNLLFEDHDLIVNDHSRGWSPSMLYNPGVFTWLIEYEFEGERKIISGDVTLLH